jgi:hypothetical protein
MTDEAGRAGMVTAAILVTALVTCVGLGVAVWGRASPSAASDPGPCKPKSFAQWKRAIETSCATRDYVCENLTVGNVAAHLNDREAGEATSSMLGGDFSAVLAVVTLVDEGRKRSGCPAPVEPCEANGQTGTCIEVSKCQGNSFPGHCPGSSDIQCCVPWFQHHEP